MANKGLGKGLGSLIRPMKKEEVSSSQDNASTSDAGIMQVSVESIVANPYQPRTEFDEQALEDLKASIKEHGIIQPLVVRKTGDDSYELIAGERRFRSAKDVGLKKVPVIVRDATKQQRLELALIENIQRANLNPLEEALSYKRLQDEFMLTHEEIANRVGKSRSVISNTLRLLNLPEKIQDALRAGKITMSHARTLVGITDEKKQMDLFEKILKEGMSVSDTEEKVAEVEVKKHTRKKHFDPVVREIEGKLRDRLKTKVRIDKKEGRGKIVIEFYSEEEFKNTIDELM